MTYVHANSSEAASALITGVLNVKTKSTSQKKSLIKIIVSCKQIPGVNSPSKGRKINWKIFSNFKQVKEGSNITNENGVFELDLSSYLGNEIELEFQKHLQRKIIGSEDLIFEYAC